MAKILVADDNSNVQKTVALALAELGVDVVAVNNGEAAVRKLAEFSPDLVLADIFMPVRNGYEVCEYVKKDPRFAHVPVVLLVGAFDPLDEREAQRVHADGILKKPFVPPDPLITMVKTLLERTMGERLVAVAATKPAVPAQAKAESVAVVVAPAPELPSFEELPENETPAPLHSAAFNEGERPVAFGQLLETVPHDSAAPAAGVAEPVDNEQVLTSTRDANLGDPIFWRTDEPVEESDADSQFEIEQTGTKGLEPEDWKHPEDTHAHPLPMQAEELPPAEPLELIREGEDESTHSVVESGSILLDAAAQAPLTVESGKAPDLAANPLEWMATAPPAGSPEAPAEHLQSPAQLEQEPPEMEAADPGAQEHISSAPVPAASGAATHTPELEKIPATVSSLEFTPAPPNEKIADKLLDPAKPQPSLQPVKPDVEDTARSIPMHDWADLTSVLKPVNTSLTSPLSKPEPAPNESAASVFSVTPIAPLSVPSPIEPVVVEHAQSPITATAPSGANAEMVEAVVQRVLDKMRPQVVEIITKEFLRPIVQALVQREVEKP